MQSDFIDCKKFFNKLLRNPERLMGGTRRRKQGTVAPNSETAVSENTQRKAAISSISHENPRSRLQRIDFVIAIIICVIGTLVYTEGGNPSSDMTNDVLGNVWTPIVLLRHGKFNFDHLNYPWFFRFGITDTGNVKDLKGSIYFRKYNSVPADSQKVVGELEFTAGDLYENGILHVHAKRGRAYNVVNSNQGGVINTFGAGAPLTFLPVVTLAVTLGVSDLDELADPDHFDQLARLAGFTAAGLVAFSTALIYLAVRVSGSVRSGCVVVAFTYGYGSCMWSISSGALWQHGPNNLYTAAAMCLCALSDNYFLQHGRSLALMGAGLCVGMAVLCRPAAVTWAVAVGLWLFHSRRWIHLGAFVAGGLPCATFLAWYNFNHFGSIITSGQTIASLSVAKYKGAPADFAGLWSAPITLGMSTLLFSPARGIFFISPWVMLSVITNIFSWVRQARQHKATTYLTANASHNFHWVIPWVFASGAQILLASKWFDYYGGWCYGYRPIVDTTPVLAVLLGISLPTIYKSTTLRALFGASLVWSVWQQIVGASAYNPTDWNNRWGMVSRDPSSGKIREYLYCDFDYNRMIPVLPVNAQAMVTAAEKKWGPTKDTAHDYRCAHRDIDDPLYRDRLWDFAENPAFFFTRNFWGARSLHKGQASELALALVPHPRARLFSELKRGDAVADQTKREKDAKKYRFKLSDRVLGGPERSGHT